MDKVKRSLRKHSVVIRPYVDVDRAILYEAYKDGSFDMPEGMSYIEFIRFAEEKFSGYNSIWMVIDSEKPIAVVVIRSDGYVIEPHVEFFNNATPAAILRSTTRFFQWVGTDDSVGACVVKCLDKSKGLFQKMCEYGMLLYVGKIPNGHPDGDEYLYCIDRRK